MDSLYVSVTPSWVNLFWALWFSFSFSIWWWKGSGIEAYWVQEEEEEEVKATPVPAPVPVEEPYETKYLARFRAAVAANANANANAEWTEDRLRELQYNRLLEHTPLGNVLMYYNHDTESFVYFSDMTLPYRYLDTVGRKYTLTFRCTHLYVDMEEVLREAEAKAAEAKAAASTAPLPAKTDAPPKRDVFARFKTYNKDTVKATAAVPVAPKNKAATTQRPPSQVLLKDRANHYTWQGKFLDCPMLQKVDRTKVDKRWGMRFADFKKVVAAQEKLGII